MKSKGYALLEIIVSISLLILFLSFSFSLKSIENYRNDCAFKEFIFYLRNANVNAGYRLNDRTDLHQIRLDTEENSYTVIIGGKERKIYFPEGVEIISSNLGGLIAFGRHGHSRGGTMKFKVNDKKYKVTIACISGRIHCWEMKVEEN